MVPAIGRTLSSAGPARRSPRPEFAGLALATCPEQQIRDGRAAIVYAERAVAATQGQDANCLDTLAAAYAENGQFTEAVGAENKALSLAAAEKRKTEFRARLSLYQANQPARDRSTAAPY